jgi:hypothetical protein
MGFSSHRSVAVKKRRVTLSASLLTAAAADIVIESWGDFPERRLATILVAYINPHLRRCHVGSLFN